MADLETKDEARTDFVPSEGLSTAGTPQLLIALLSKPQVVHVDIIHLTEAMELLAIHGRNELVEKTKPKWRIYLDQVWCGGSGRRVESVCSYTAPHTQLIGPMPIMIWYERVLAMGFLLGTRGSACCCIVVHVPSPTYTGLP